MHQCLNCQSELQVRELRCMACEIGYVGDFQPPRLARLSASQQLLAEQLVMAAGNLKQMAAGLQVSYPTLRKRLDDLIDALASLRAADDARIDDYLKAVETGRLTPEAAARRIKELNGAI